ncbi:uncharacterized protein N0V89_012608 [Didymosphaeria variabile]|uniref:RING-type domain-containing protein n=1 Tax=Didymosphaeria variabile TaxID=1932322 RepID=A0A9W9C562_9PLEO|nr:uncharacterized protein N0V89_012608 [Didymosphaeria variabile]KAJ4344864.1 hypothetical protein N0V89_012608 [Didymosphaeria variabile]
MWGRQRTVPSLYIPSSDHNIGVRTLTFRLSERHPLSPPQAQPRSTSRTHLRIPTDMGYSKAAGSWASSTTFSMWASANASSNRFAALAAETESDGEASEGLEEEVYTQLGSGENRIQSKSKPAKKSKKHAKAEAKAEAVTGSEAGTKVEAEGSTGAGAHRNANLECSACGDRFPIEEYPVIEGCKHKPETCGQCLEAWIDSQLDNTIADGGIRCPSTCDRKLSYAELKGKISAGLHSK